MPPNFRREIGVGPFLFSALLATLCGLLENVGPFNLSSARSHERGVSRVLKETVLLSVLLIV